MSRAKRTRKQPARRAARPASRPQRRSRKPASSRVAAASAAAPRPSARLAAGWSTIRVIWRPALAVATLPMRVYRVYRWAEAEQARASL